MGPNNPRKLVSSGNLVLKVKVGVLLDGDLYLDAVNVNKGEDNNKKDYEDSGTVDLPRLDVLVDYGL